MQRNWGKQQNGKDQRPLQENQRYQGDIPSKDWIIKDRNSMDLTEAEDEVGRIHRKTRQKALNDTDNYDGVITHPQPNILGCEVKWALGNIITSKASSSD